MTNNNDSKEVTPITRQPIHSIRSDRWSKMSISELWEEYSTLNNRLNYALQLGNLDMINQLQMGIDFINAIIQDKTSKESKLL